MKKTADQNHFTQVKDMILEYRVMQERDIKDVLLFWRNINGVHMHSNGEETYDAILSYLQRNPDLSFVAVSDSKIIGAVMCGHDGRRGYLIHLGVSMEYRRKGIAKQLLDRVEKELSKIGIKKEALFVLCDNSSAQEFYEHIGWKEETIVKMYSKLIPKE